MIATRLGDLREVAAVSVYHPNIELTAAGGRKRDPVSIGRPSGAWHPVGPWVRAADVGAIRVHQVNPPLSAVAVGHERDGFAIGAENWRDVIGGLLVRLRALVHWRKSCKPLVPRWYCN